MTPSEQIDARIAELTDWRGTLYAKLRAIILETDPALTEEWKWDTAVWSLQGPICAVSAFKGHVKLNFFKGASLSDPEQLFNSGLDSKSHRSINFTEDSVVDSAKLQALIREAIKVQTN